MIDFTNLNKQRDELSVAINSNDLERLQSIINRSNKEDGPATTNMNLNYLDKDGQTPLHLACIQGNIYICKALMEAGASQSIKNKDGWFPIHLASYLGHLDIVFYLLDDGKKTTSIDVYDDDNEQAMFKSHDFRLSFVENKRYRTSEEDEEDDDDEEKDYSSDSSSSPSPSSPPSSSDEDDENNENEAKKKQSNFNTTSSQLTDYPFLFDEIFDLKNLDLSAKDFVF